MQPVLLDLRGPEDFACGHISAAINFPLKALKRETSSPFQDSSVLESQWLELESMFHSGGSLESASAMDGGQPIILVCYEGDTSRVATSVLRSRGIEALSIAGGMEGLSKLLRRRTEIEVEVSQAERNLEN